MAKEAFFLDLVRQDQETVNGEEILGDIGEGATWALG